MSGWSCVPPQPPPQPPRDCSLFDQLQLYPQTEEEPPEDIWDSETLDPDYLIVSFDYVRRLQDLVIAQHSRAGEYAAIIATTAVRDQQIAFSFGVRERDASPQHAVIREAKQRRVDDGMEIVLYEPPCSAPRQDTAQNSAATIASSVAADTDQGVDQPHQQPLALAAGPSSIEEGAAAAPDSQAPFGSDAPLHEVVHQLQHAVLQLQRAVLQSPMQAPPMQAASPQPNTTQPPKQKPAKQQPSQQKPAVQPSKQPQQQPIKVHTQQHLYAEALVAGCGAMVKAKPRETKAEALTRSRDEWLELRAPAAAPTAAKGLQLVRPTAALSADGGGAPRGHLGL